jgi:hypothetical protein
VLDGSVVTRSTGARPERPAAALSALDQVSDRIDRVRAGDDRERPGRARSVDRSNAMGRPAGQLLCGWDGWRRAESDQ